MLRLLYLCLLLAVSQTMLAQTNQKTVLFDDFATNKNSWKEYFSGNYIDVVNNGKFIMENTNDGTHWSGIYAAINNSRNFSITVSTNHTSGVDNSHYGVYFGAKDGNNGYCFAISSNGWYRLFKYENSTFVNLIDWVQHSAIVKGNYVENKIKITKDGSDWKFYVNDQYITSYGARVFYGDYVGFSVSRNQRVEFDNLNIVEYDGGNSNVAPVTSVTTTGNDTQTDIFKDDFSDNKNNWQPSSSTSFTTALSNGKYIIDAKDSTTVTSVRTIYFKPEKDFTYSLSLMHTSGVMNYGYGLVFNYTDTKNYYGFQISGDGSYRFYNLINNTATNLIPWTKSSSIKTGNYADNIISIKKQGSAVYLYINGTYQNSATVNAITTQKIGFVVARPQRIEFDNMKLTGVYDYLDIPDDDLDLGFSTNKEKDFSIYTKDYKSGNLCELMASILKNAKDTFVHITSGIRYKGSWSNVHNTTYTIKDADSTTLSHSKYGGYFYAYLGNFTETEVKTKLEAWKKKIPDCLPGHTTFIPSNWKDGQTLYIGQKIPNGIVYSDASLYVSKGENGKYKLAFTASFSSYKTEFIYINDKSDNSDFSKQINFLLADAEKAFPAISGEMYKDGTQTLYKTNYQFPGSVENRIPFFLGKTFESTLDVGIESETEAKAKMGSYASKIKAALGKDFMYSHSEKSYFNGYTFNKKDRLYDDNSITIEVHKDYIKKTYKILLKVRGPYQPSK